MQGNVDLDYSKGCLLPLQDWAWLNRHGAFENEILRKYVAPFPPRGLMFIVSRLTREKDFAAHGVDFYLALSEISQRPLSAYHSILDFGCGCGRLLRMFVGHPGRISACDVDPRLISWVIRRLPFVNAVLSDIQPPLPYRDSTFDCIISISNFTHFSRSVQDAFLEELNRISKPEANLFVTVHGRKALRQFMEHKDKQSILDQMIDVFNRGEHVFIPEKGYLNQPDDPDHRSNRRRKGTRIRRVLSALNNVRLTRSIYGAMLTPNPLMTDAPYEYGLAFHPEEYIYTDWTQWFEIVDYRKGAIHDFQDMVYLKPKVQSAGEPIRSG